jgi:hypothetical protein
MAAALAGVEETVEDEHHRELGVALEASDTSSTMWTSRSGSGTVPPRVGDRVQRPMDSTLFRALKSVGRASSTFQIGAVGASTEDE